jgi:hypothetical protein
MAGRVYRIPMNQLAIGTSKQDLWAITASSSIPLWLEEIRLDPIATSVAEYLLSIQLFTGSFTAGSGGASVTPTPTLPNDAAAGATAKIGNTTQTAVGTGTKTQKDAGNWNLVNGWAWQPLDTDHRIAVPPSGCIVLSLDTTPTAATVNGCAIIREMY